MQNDRWFMVMNHPLIEDKLAMIRNKNTLYKEFREIISEIAMLMCYEATRDLSLKEEEIETPIQKTTCKILDKKMIFVPILRAGVGMVDGVRVLVPSAKIGHIGLYRDPKTLEPIEYYKKLPPDVKESEIIVLDPMLATGGTAVDAISIIKKYSPQKIKFMCIIASPEGVKNLRKIHPDVQIFCAALDEKLNKFGYIVPGLGDAGDRIFGTK